MNSYKEILKLNIPIFISIFIKALYDIIEMMIVRNSINESSTISSLGSITPVFMIINTIGVSILTSSTVLISKNKDNLFYKEGFIISFVLSIILFLVMFFYPGVIINFLRQTKEISNICNYYLKYRSFEVIYTFMFYTYSAKENANKKPYKPVIVLLCQIILTITIFFITKKYYSNTLIVICLSSSFASLLLSFVLHHLILKEVVKIKEKIKIKDIIRILRFTFTLILGGVITQVGFIFLNSIIKDFNKDALSSFSILNRISTLFLSFSVSLSQTLNVLLSKEVFNSSNYKTTLKKVVILGLVSSFILTIILLIFNKDIVTLFTSNNEVINNSFKFNIFIALSLPIVTIFQMVVSIFDSLERPLISSFLHFIRLWGVRITLVLILIKIIGLQNEILWYTLPISNLIPIIVGIIIYKRLRRKKCQIT